MEEQSCLYQGRAHGGLRSWQLLLDWVVVISFTVILQNVYSCGFVLFCIYHMSQVERKHASHAWNDTQIFRREGNEI